MPSISRRLLQKRTLTDAACYVAGSALYAMSVNIFTAPNHIAPGGVTGVATLLNYIWRFLPIGTVMLLLNVPLLIAAWRHLGRSFTVRTAIVTVLVSVIIDATEPFLPAFRGDHMLTALFGGVLSGAGLGLIFMRGATTGGSEVVARLLEQRLPHVPIGRLILLVDAVVIVASAVVYRQVEAALYATVLFYFITTVMDGLIYGSHKIRMRFIMSDGEQEIAAAVLERLHRGVTMLDATGAYTGERRRVLLCAVRPSEVYELRTLVRDLDPKAFIIVTTSDEVLGEGFREGETEP